MKIEIMNCLVFFLCQPVRVQKVECRYPRKMFGVFHPQDPNRIPLAFSLRLIYIYHEMLEALREKYMNALLYLWAGSMKAALKPASIEGILYERLVTYRGNRQGRTPKLNT